MTSLSFSVDDINLSVDGQDLVGLHEELTFLPGHTDEVKCVTVTTIDDDIYEGIEHRGIVLTSDTDITLDPKVAILDILDDDG